MAETKDHANASMSTDSNMFPVDMLSLKTFGVERWMNGYQWPVHWQLYAEFNEALFAGLERVFLDVDLADRETLLAGGDFISHVRDILHAEAVRAWASERGLELDMRPATRNIYAPDFAVLETFLKPSSSGIGSRISFGLRGAVRGWVENGNLNVGRRVAGSFGLCRSWSLGTMHGLKREALAQSGELVRTVYADPLLDRARSVMRPQLSPKLEAAMDAFGADLADAVDRTLGAELSVRDFSTRRLIEIWKLRLGQSAGWIDAIRQIVRRPPQRLHINEVWKTPNRLISFALRGKGTEVVAYAHGNDPMHVLQTQHAFFAFPHTSVYVCETTASAREHHAHYTSSEISKTFPVRFDAVETDLYARTFSAAKMRAVGVRPRVMVVGYPMNPVRTQYDVTNFFAFHLEGELRMIKLLKANGFEVLYKAHPDRREEVEGVHSEHADKVIFEPFEKVVDQADAVVFLTTVSSTFGMALCTRKPVVVLDNKGKAWNPALREMLARRCRFVRSELNDRNQIAFDEEGLLRALQLPGDEPDFEIVHEMFIPR